MRPPWLCLLAGALWLNGSEAGTPTTASEALQLQVSDFETIKSLLKGLPDQIVSPLKEELTPAVLFLRGIMMIDFLLVRLAESQHSSWSAPIGHLLGGWGQSSSSLLSAVKHGENLLATIPLIWPLGERERKEREDCCMEGLFLDIIKDQSKSGCLSFRSLLKVWLLQQRPWQESILQSWPSLPDEPAWPGIKWVRPGSGEARAGNYLLLKNAFSRISLLLAKLLSLGLMLKGLVTLVDQLGASLSQDSAEIIKEILEILLEDCKVAMALFQPNFQRLQDLMRGSQELQDFQDIFVLLPPLQAAATMTMPVKQAVFGPLMELLAATDPLDIQNDIPRVVASFVEEYHGPLATTCATFVQYVGNLAQYVGQIIIEQDLEYLLELEREDSRWLGFRREQANNAISLALERLKRGFSNGSAKEFMDCVRKHSAWLTAGYIRQDLVDAIRGHLEHVWVFYMAKTREYGFWVDLKSRLETLPSVKAELGPAPYHVHVALERLGPLYQRYLDDSFPPDKVLQFVRHSALGLLQIDWIATMRDLTRGVRLLVESGSIDTEWWGWEKLESIVARFAIVQRVLGQHMERGRAAPLWGDGELWSSLPALLDISSAIEGVVRHLLGELQSRSSRDNSGTDASSGRETGEEAHGLAQPETS